MVENPHMKEIVEGNFKGLVGTPRAANGDCQGSALLFVNDGILNDLNEAEIIMADGTMKATPDIPQASQIWIISFRKNDKSFAAVFAVCRRATAVLYEAILCRFSKIVPGLKNVKLIVSDFERAALKAFANVLPLARLMGCWFHFIKASSEHWKKLLEKYDLHDAPREPKYLLHSLPLLSHYHAEKGIKIISQKSSYYEKLFPDLRHWADYVNNQWGRIPEIVSVHNCCIRTNNDSEADNRQFTPRAGGNLQEILRDEVTNMTRMKNGLPIVKTKLMEIRFNRDMCLLVAQKNVSKQEITLDEIYTFLKQCLPEEQSKRIDEEQCISLRDNVTREMFKRASKMELKSLSAEKDEEYGVKRKCQRRRRRTTT
ncbi:uncharacterized protein LOC107046883 isoform X2 [Diachasma alloeum]|uniref:uncharacterized protein LOC107046883 isoform X2 n=1 Tax=Diachasma alloeum TaxID=454923 RepID=UPI000738306D|nr:uncharacterized protein LOC107046883 isoform X2 [Diachasma alloeum]